MSCNAWNHPPDCSCGWGGDTGGGGYSGVYAKRIADGRAWSGHSLTYESFTIPNACCPVCGEAVFFYQSSVIISHDAPQFIAERIAAEIAHASTGSGSVARPAMAEALSTSRTRAFLTEVFAIVQPRLWIFGHWHHAWAYDEGNTHFRAMGFQEAFTVALPWLETE